jgi:hypothetical protein
MKKKEGTMLKLTSLKTCMVLFILMQTNLKAQTPGVLQSISYEQQGDLIPFYGISLRREGLTTTDNQGRHAWEIDTVLSLRISDIRYPAGSQSYLMNEILKKEDASDENTR